MVREYSHRMWITFQIPCKTMDKEIYREKAGYKLILPFKSGDKTALKGKNNSHYFSGRNGLF